MFALEITDSELTLVKIKLGKIVKHSLKLPPGVFFNGEIKDFSGFKLALNGIHEKVAPLSQNVDVVVTALSGRTSVEHVTVVASLRDNNESDLQNLLRVDLLDKYRVIQELESTDKHKKEFLIAWTEKKILEELKDVVSGANFNILDFELVPFSLARLIRTKKSEVRFELTNDGLILMKFSNDNFIDYKFHSLFSLQEEIGGRDIKKELLDQLIEEKIKNFNTGGFEVVKMNASAAIGAAMKFGILEKISFLVKFTKIALYSLIAVFIVIGITDAVLMSVSSSFKKILSESISSPEVLKAAEFKILVSLAKSASDASHLTILKELYKAVDQRITMERILIDEDRGVFVNGKAISEAAVIAFRDRLIKSEAFQDVVLPLANLEKIGNLSSVPSSGGEGKIKFSLSAKLK